MPRRPPRRDTRSLRHVRRLRQRHQITRVQRRSLHAAHLGPGHRRAPQLAVAQPAEERFHQRMPGGEGIVLLVPHRHLAPERSQHGAVLLEIESRQRVYLELGPDVERHLAGQHVHLDVHRQPDALGRLDGHRLEPRLQQRRDRLQRGGRVVDQCSALRAPPVAGGPRSSRADARPQPLPAALRQRAHRRQIAAAQIEQRVVGARHLRPRRRDAPRDLGGLARPLLRIVAGSEREQLRLDALQHRVEPARRLGEDAHARVEHFQHARGQRALGREGVDAHLARLPDAVDAPDALLDGGRAPGEIVVRGGRAARRDRGSAPPACRARPARDRPDRRAPRCASWPARRAGTRRSRASRRTPAPSPGRAPARAGGTPPASNRATRTARAAPAFSRPPPEGPPQGTAASCPAGGRATPAPRRKGAWPARAPRALPPRAPAPRARAAHRSSSMYAA